jgi:hypothetical protein
VSNSFDELKLKIAECMDIAPTKTVKVISEALSECDVRSIIAVVGDPIGTHPQVELTVTLDDVTAKVVAQVVDPILRKVGVPEDAVLLASAGAGEGAIRLLRNYQKKQAQRAAMRQRMENAVAGGYTPTQPQSPPAPSTDNGNPFGAGK